MKRIRLTEANKHEHTGNLCFNIKTGKVYLVGMGEYELVSLMNDLLYYLPDRWYPVFRGSRYIGYQTPRCFTRMPND